MQNLLNKEYLLVCIIHLFFFLDLKSFLCVCVCIEDSRWTNTLRLAQQSVNRLH